jgi:signal transduction histidine kinase
MAALCTGLLLIAIFATMVIKLQSDLRREIHQKIIERDAAVLYPVALQQMADSETNGPGAAATSSAPFTALLQSARQQGMLAIAVFDRDGNTIEAMPATQIFVELPMEDYWRLQNGGPITRYHAEFPLDQYFSGVSREQRREPVLEVLLPLPDSKSLTPRGFVRYFIDARPLSRELAIIDERINRQTAVTLLIGLLLVVLVLIGAAYSVQRAQRIVAERNDRLARANFELTLAAKASALGQLTSHLIHELQGSVEGLHAVVANREGEAAGTAWQSAANYTERLQRMIRETVALLADAGAHVSYELTGRELAAIIRERNKTAATDKGVLLEVKDGFAGGIESRCGSLLCLIANNLVQNAIAATGAGGRILVSLATAEGLVELRVQDAGSGISPAMRDRLFRPGFSSRPGGSGLGLAISQLLARQMGAEIMLLSTGPAGTTFCVKVPLEETAAPK